MNPSFWLEADVGQGGTALSHMAQNPRDSDPRGLLLRLVACYWRGGASKRERNADVTRTHSA